MVACASMFCMVAVLGLHETSRTIELTIDPASTSLVMQGHVFRQPLDCNHNPAGSNVDLGPLVSCPSGSSLIPFDTTGTFKMVVALQYDPVLGRRVSARFAGGRLLVPDFQAFVGDCASPDVEILIHDFEFNFVSDPFALAQGGSPAGCAPGDNYRALIRMLVLSGGADVTVPPLSAQPVSFQCDESNLVPACGRFTRSGNQSAVVATFGSSNPILIPWSYEVAATPACVPPLPRYFRFSGTLRFTGQLRAVLSGVIPGPPGDPSPDCP